MVGAQNFIGMAEDQKQQLVVDLATSFSRYRLELPSLQAADALLELASLHMGVQNFHDSEEVSSQSPEAL